MNYFAYRSAARRYAKGRPFFQPLVAERIRRACFPEGQVERALDIGCGTGQSTMALAAIAETVIGADSSPAMLANAEAHACVLYVGGAAETLPFASYSFDLITAGLAFHWFDRNGFLREAARVLRPGGWLAIYNHHFSGRMNGDEQYARWNQEQYAKRFPAPPRHSEPFTDDDALSYGFAPYLRDRFTHTVAFTPEQLVNYLLTHSNIIAVAEGGSQDIGSIAAWLNDSIRPLFTTAAAEFPFNCVLDIFRRQRDNR